MIAEFYISSSACDNIPLTADSSNYSHIVVVVVLLLILLLLVSFVTNRDYVIVVLVNP